MIRSLTAIGVWFGSVLAADGPDTVNLWGMAEKYGPFFVLLVLLLWWGREDRKAEKDREDARQKAIDNREDAKQKALDEREDKRIERSDKRWDETNQKQFEMNERYVVELARVAEVNSTIAKNLELQDAKRLTALAEQTKVLSDLADELRGRPCLLERKKKGD